LDFCEAQDQGYEFHFTWLLILIAFTIWEMPEGATFLDIDPFEPLTTNFTTLWYSSNMGKQWQLNEVSISHILSPVEEGYWGCPLHGAKHHAPVHTPHEVLRRSILYLYYCACR
jgi:hypothetical protein